VSSARRGKLSRFQKDHVHEGKPRPSRRIGRIASRMKFLISEVIRREVRDPRIGFLTVLDVEPTEDLKEAKVYYSVLGSEGDRSKTQHALEKARSFIQREVGRNLETRNTPVLRFILDDSYDKASRMEALIQKASQEDRETKMAKKPSKKPGKPEGNKPEGPGKKPGKKGKPAFDEEEDLELEEDEEEEEEEEEEDGDDEIEPADNKVGTAEENVTVNIE
jgi:ribosome-binding factor A